MRVAIVHERFTELGGSERVVEELHRIWPDAPVFTPIADPAAVPPGMAGAELRLSPLQRLYRGGRQYAHLLPLLPRAMAGFDLSGFDVVVTSHHAFANRVRPPAGVPVLSYTHTPARWIWSSRMRRGERGGMIGRAALAAFAATQRAPDRAAAGRVAGILANSKTVAGRIEQWWGQPSDVVHPPVDVSWYTPDPNIPREEFFLSVGRLVAYKRPAVAVSAARRAGAAIVVVGEGRERAAVERAAGRDAELLGYVDNEALRDLYRRCRALVFTGEEDFGIVPLEAQACGAPVIALAAGGALETVIDGVTGTWYSDDRDGIALAEALRRFDPADFDPLVIRRHAEKYAPDRFRDEVRKRLSTLVDAPRP